MADPNTTKRRVGAIMTMQEENRSSNTTAAERIFVPLLALGSLAMALMGEPIGWLLLGMWLGRFA